MNSALRFLSSQNSFRSLVPVGLGSSARYQFLRILYFHIVKRYGVMARVQYGGIITELKGKVGGSVFQSNAYGYSLKNKGQLRRQKTNFQSTYRGLFSTAVAQWHAMTDAQRTAFNSVAGTYPWVDKFGNPGTLNGYNLFVMLAQNLQLAGQAINTTALPSAGSLAITAASLVADVSLGTMVLSFAPAPAGTTDVMVLAASGPQQPGSAFKPSACKIIYTRTTSGSTPQNVHNEYVKVFGVFPPVNSIIWFMLYNIKKSTGEASAKYIFSSKVQP